METQEGIVYREGGIQQGGSKGHQKVKGQHLKCLTLGG